MKAWRTSMSLIEKFIFQRVKRKRNFSWIPHNFHAILTNLSYLIKIERKCSQLIGRIDQKRWGSGDGWRAMIKILLIPMNFDVIQLTWFIDPKKRNVKKTSVNKHEISNDPASTMLERRSQSARKSYFLSYILVN
jgi:hypothetical protein